MPRVLIADSLSPAAVDIFRQRGVDADIKTGLSNGPMIQVTEGLRNGETVVSRGSLFVDRAAAGS